MVGSRPRSLASDGACGRHRRVVVETGTCGGREIANAGRSSITAMLGASAVTTVGALPIFLCGALSVQLRHQFAFDAGQLGYAVSAFFGSSAICGLVAGRLADRFGGVRVMRVGIVTTAMSLAAIAMVARSWGQLLAALTVAGVGNGAIQPAANRYLSRTVGPVRQGLAFGVKQAAIPGATLISGLSVPVLSAHFGWRWTFGLGFILACAAVSFVRSSVERRHLIESAAGPGGKASPRALLTLAVGNACGSAAVNSMGAFFVASAVTLGVADSTAALLAGVGGAISVCVRVLGGTWADRSNGHLRLVALLALLGAVGYALLATDEPALLVPAVMVGYGAGWGWAGLLTFAVVRAHPMAAGRATGVTQVGASVGACLGPLTFGSVVVELGYASAWVCASAALAGAALLIHVGSRRFPLSGTSIEPVAAG